MFYLLTYPLPHCVSKNAPRAQREALNFCERLYTLYSHGVHSPPHIITAARKFVHIYKNKYVNIVIGGMLLKNEQSLCCFNNMRF